MQKNKTKMLEMQIEGMTCDGCEKTIRGALEGLPEVTHVWNVNWKNCNARIEVEEKMEECCLISTVEKLGYKVKVLPGGGSSQRGDKEHSRTPVNFKSCPKNGFDLLIIGAGSAGFAGAIRASELGARVGLIEGGVIGGTCVNVGCVPSKTLIRAAEIQHRAETRTFRGIVTSAKPPQWNEIRSQKDELVNLLRQVKYIDVLKNYPSVEYIEGSAKPLKNGEVELSNGNRLKTQKILITTGARSWAPPIPGLNEVKYLDSTSAMNVEELPKSMIVIGAAAAGLELAQMFSRLGVKVTVIEVAPRIVPLEDQEIGDALAQYLTEEGMTIFAGAKIHKVSQNGKGYKVEIEKDGKHTILAEQLLVATGRRPNTESLRLKEIGVELGPKGHIRTNEYLQTNDPDIYAAGDCASEAMFVYVSAYGGNLAAENAVSGNNRKFDLSVLPKVTFTDPQVASVGITEIEAHAKGIDLSWAKIQLDHIPKAVAARDTRGFIKLVAESKTGRLLGAHILAPEGGELIQIPALAIKYEITVDELGRTLFPYLTLSEGIKLCAQTFNKDVSKLSCCAA